MNQNVREKILNIADAAASDCLKIMGELSRTHGEEAGDEFQKLFLTIVVGASVKYSLDYPRGKNKNMTDEQKYQCISRSYLDQKILIQEAVALGFTEAVSANGQYNDYVCKIWLPQEPSKAKN